MSNSKRIKILYVFTSGSLNSPNNKMWLKGFKHFNNLNISVLVQEPDNFALNEFSDDISNIEMKYSIRASETKKIFKLLKNFFSIRQYIKKNEPDIIHVHGCYFTYILLPILFQKIKSKIIFNVWGNDFNKLYNESWKHKFIFKWLFKKSSIIWCNWITMQKKVIDQFPNYKEKTKLVLWGIEMSAAFPPEKKNILEVTDLFKIKKNQFCILYSKGMLRSNNHYYLLKALNELNPEYNFKLIMLGGNKKNKYCTELENFIIQNNLSNKVVISYEFISDELLKALVYRSDLTLSIPEKDQLTRTIFESILQKTEIILSDIEPYRQLNDYFNFKLELIDPKDTKSFTKILDEKINSGKNISYDSYIKTINENYLFESRINDFNKIYKSIVVKEQC